MQLEHERQREWKVRQGISDPTPSAERLVQQTGLSPLVLRILGQRGWVTTESIQAFMHPSLSQLTNPFQIQDMDRAVKRLKLARDAGERVLVYGDYDVDGTAGAALLSRVLTEFGFLVEVVQPDRFKDGYGLHSHLLEAAYQRGIRLVVAVDTGITGFAAVDRANELGLDAIIVDHHKLDPVRGIPAAVAVINPQREDCLSGLKQLCGCGLAFYLSMALRARGREWGWFAGRADPNLKRHLDLVVLATAADMVPLTGDNRILVSHGMRVLRQTDKAGLKAMIQSSGLNLETVSPGHLGFVLGPRINASGRLQSASIALELLTTHDADRASVLAAELEALNSERQAIQNQIWDEVRAQVDQGLAEGRFSHAIVAASSGWHEGVVGIVASRVTELYRRPAAVIALREDIGKGSVRSYGGRDVLAGLRHSAEHLLGYGGHQFAAGLSLALDQIAAFEAQFNAAFAPGGPANRVEADILWIDGETELAEFSLKALTELEMMGPFGPGNPEPVFRVRARGVAGQLLKGRHLKLKLEQLMEFDRPAQVDAIWFNAGERADVQADVSASDHDFEWAVVPELNRFRGRVTPSLRVKDRRIKSP